MVAEGDWGGAVYLEVQSCYGTEKQTAFDAVSQVATGQKWDQDYLLNPAKLSKSCREAVVSAQCDTVLSVKSRELFLTHFGLLEYSDEMKS